MPTVLAERALVLDSVARRGGLPPPKPMATPVPGEEPSISLRENFNALAVFAPSVHTDSNGRAQVQVKLPDNLTRYQGMAGPVAGGKQIGSAQPANTAA